MRGAARHPKNWGESPTRGAFFDCICIFTTVTFTAAVFYNNSLFNSELSSSKIRRLSSSSCVKKNQQQTAEMLNTVPDAMKPHQGPGPSLTPGYGVTSPSQNVASAIVFVSFSRVCVWKV